MSTLQAHSVNGQPATQTPDVSTTRLVRVRDWVCDGPYWVLAQENSRIVKLGLSAARAAEWLRDQGLREFDVDYSLYSAELWARRQGSQAPLYGLDESRPACCWNVLLQSEDFR